MLADMPWRHRPYGWLLMVTVMAAALLSHGPAALALSLTVYDDLDEFVEDADLVVIGLVAQSHTAETSAGPCDDTVLMVLPTSSLVGSAPSLPMTVRLQGYCNDAPIPSGEAVYFLVCDTFWHEFTPISFAGVVENQDGAVHVSTTLGAPFMDRWIGRSFDEFIDAIRRRVADDVNRPRESLSPSPGSSMAVPDPVPATTGGVVQATADMGESLDC